MNKIPIRRGYECFFVSTTSSETPSPRRRTLITWRQAWETFYSLGHGYSIICLYFFRSSPKPSGDLPWSRGPVNSSGACKRQQTQCADDPRESRQLCLLPIEDRWNLLRRLQSTSEMSYPEEVFVHWPEGKDSITDAPPGLPHPGHPLIISFKGKTTEIIPEELLTPCFTLSSLNSLAVQ